VQGGVDVFLSAPVAPTPPPPKVEERPPATPTLGPMAEEAIEGALAEARAKVQSEAVAVAAAPVVVAAPVVAAPVVAAPVVAAPVVAAPVVAAPVEQKAAEPAPERPAAAEEDPGNAASLEDSFFQSGGEDGPIEPVVESPDEPRDGEETYRAFEEEEPAFGALSPAAMARRARMRRIVGMVVGFVGVLALAVLGKTVASSSRSSSSSAPATPVKTAAPAPQPEPPKPEAKPAAPAPAPTAEAKPAETAAPEPEKPAAAASDPARSAALEKETIALLNRGKYKDAIEKAKEAIAADPEQAMPYLYLGSALQDTGKWKDGIEVYSECVRKATKGPVHECRQMGGKK
jgi:hypothetical protein